MGIMYSHVTPDCLKNFHKFSEEIAAHFSEVKLICEEFYFGSQQLCTYWSNNGILRLIKKCKIDSLLITGRGERMRHEGLLQES